MKFIVQCSLIIYYSCCLAVQAEEKLTRAAVKDIRQQKLVELFSREDQEYEAELERFGLSFRRDRT